MSFIIDKGTNNRIIIKEIFSKMGSQIIVEGSNNLITLEDNVMFRNSKISILGDNNICLLSKDSQFKNSVLTLRNSSSIYIGKQTTLARGEIFAAESSCIKIGDNCMLAKGYEIRSSDVHPIWDINNGKRINNSEDILIGNHVWLAKDTMVMKGTELQSFTTVAARAVVTSKFNRKFIIIGGVPAKIIKSNVVWGRSVSSKTINQDKYLHSNQEFIDSSKEYTTQK